VPARTPERSLASRRDGGAHRRSADVPLARRRDAACAEKEQAVVTQIPKLCRSLPLDGSAKQFQYVVSVVYVIIECDKALT
jgi:hypothetical protein